VKKQCSQKIEVDIAQGLVVKPAPIREKTDIWKHRKNSNWRYKEWKFRLYRQLYRHLYPDVNEWERIDTDKKKMNI